MKRTNLVLDAAKLELACQVLGERTYSGAVNRALDEAIKMAKVRNIANSFASGIWEGNLQEMR